MSQKQLGRYEITATLGRGAMGVVYQAHDPLIERTVAIKTVAFAGLSGRDADEFEQRFFREAKSAGRLNHPNIVTIHDVGRSDQLAYIAMEFLSGQSLRHVLDSGASLSLARILEIAAAIADGLAFAHAQGIVHRDIKPANIMVQENGVVKITDFGIAQLPGGSLTMAGAVLGSPKYMSPEQVGGHKADGRSDIFSLGTMLYEMLTDEPPFSGDNMHATMYQVVHKTPPAPSSCCPHLPDGIDSIVARAMAKDPADRYQSAAEMATDLRNLADSAASASGIATPLRRNRTQALNPAGNRAQRISRLRYSVALALLCLLGGLAYFFLRTSPPPVQSVLIEEPKLAGSVPSTPEPGTTEKPSVAAPPAAKRPLEQKSNRDAEPATRAIPPKNWKEALNADLRACSELSVFKKVVCIEQARWKHCPGHWGTIDDCPSSTGAQKTPS